MRAKTKNARNRAGRYAVVLDGLIREKVRPDMVAARIKEMRGVEAAYLYFLAEEHGQNEVTVDADDEETESEGPPIPRKGVQRTAGGGNDDMVQGEDETASPSDKSVGAAIGGRRQTPSFDPERHLLVEDEPDALDALLDVARTGEFPSASRSGLRSIRPTRRASYVWSANWVAPISQRTSRPSTMKIGRRTRASLARSRCRRR